MWLVALVVLSILVMPLSVWAQQLSGDAVAESLCNNVVKIIADRKDGGPEQGFGFIVGKRDDKVLIVTANHVIRGRGDLGPESVLRRVTITYCQDQGKSYDAKPLGASNISIDLAVLEAEFPPKIPAWSQQALGLTSDLKRGTQVWFVGRSGKWYVPIIPGIINEFTPDSRIIVEGLQILPGTSGAPLISKSGVIGMIVEDEPGATYGVPMESIKRAFEQWKLPWNLQQLRIFPSDCNKITRNQTEYLFCNSKKTWYEADQACTSYGYSLAFIGDKDEDAFLFKQMQNSSFVDTWIGLTDQDHENYWTWRNGSRALYTNWDKDEPNNGGKGNILGGENCAVIMNKQSGRESKWDDRPCNLEGYAYGFICKSSQ
jgi:Lectin C-type domain/Trypsin-like peptidase domain